MWTSSPYKLGVEPVIDYSMAARTLAFDVQQARLVG